MLLSVIDVCVVHDICCCSSTPGPSLATAALAQQCSRRLSEDWLTSCRTHISSTRLSRCVQLKADQCKAALPSVVLLQHNSKGANIAKQVVLKGTHFCAADEAAGVHLREGAAAGPARLGAAAATGGVLLISVTLVCVRAAPTVSRDPAHHAARVPVRCQPCAVAATAWRTRSCLADDCLAV